jgi:hypothetical protein
VDGKADLENQLGHRVDGFCYPGGRHDRGIARQVEHAGFSYARTIENLRVDRATRRFHIPTTIQFYPHGRWILTRNLVRRGGYSSRGGNWARTMIEANWLDRLRSLARYCAARDAIFHLWGHSWEIDALGLWAELEVFLAMVSTLKPRPCTVGDLVKMSWGADSGLSLVKKSQRFG